MYYFCLFNRRILRPGVKANKERRRGINRTVNKGEEEECACGRRTEDIGGGEGGLVMQLIRRTWF